MSQPGFVGGLPGVQTVVTASHRIIFRDGVFNGFLSGGKIIDGTLSRDPGNTGDVNVLRPGLVMGKVTASGKYAPSILGTSNVAYTSGDTSIGLTAATATELVRRVGATGTFKLVGPPTAAGTVVTATVTYSAVNTTTGVATITNIGANKISGCLVCPTDGSETFKTFIPDGFGLNVFNSGGSAADQPFPQVPTAGTVITANIINYPSDTSLITWFKLQFAADAEGKFIFDSSF